MFHFNKLFRLMAPFAINHRFLSSRTATVGLVHIKPEVSAALEEKNPVVALESTIITHGMPYPQNLETATKVENIIRVNGAIPATVAVLNGIVHVDQLLDYTVFGSTD